MKFGRQLTQTLRNVRDDIFETSVVNMDKVLIKLLLSIH